MSMGLSHFRHPFDMPAAHIFKIGADGLIHEIEAVGFIRARLTRRADS
jgi:hypothetical protein